MRTIKLTFALVIFAFSLTLLPAISAARGKSLTVRKPSSITTSTHRSAIVRGDMTRINISLSASGASAAAARRRVGSAAYQTERAVQRMIPGAKVVKGPVSVGGRYVRGNSGYSWRREEGRSSQNIVIEFKGTSGVKAAKIIDFAANSAKRASGKRTGVSVDISEAEHYLSQNKMNKAMQKLSRSLRYQATGKARGVLHANEKLDNASGQFKVSTGGYSPWRGGGYRIYGDMTLTAEIQKKK